MKVSVWCVAWLDKAKLEHVRVFDSEGDARRFERQLQQECQGGSHRKISVWEI